MDSARTSRPRSIDAAVCCSKCGSRDAIQIEMTLPDGTEVHFCSCHRCETRWWDQDGETLGLATILARSRKSR